LLHVADAANPAVLEQISAVYEVLRELGIEEKDTLLVLNQIDRLADRADLAPVQQRYPHAVPISAKSREGLDTLHAAVSAALSRSFADLDVETSVANGKLLAYLAAHGEILQRQYADDRVTIHVRIPQRHVGPLHQAGTVFRPHQEWVVLPADDRDPGTRAIEEVA
jgi:GTP-binding protein HflX